MMQAQCWICPKCNYDHGREDVCYHSELLEAKSLIKKLKNQMRAAMLYAYEDTNDRYYLNVLDESVPGWSDGCESIKKEPK